MTFLTSVDFVPRKVEAQEFMLSDDLKAQLDVTGTMVLRDASLSDWLFAIQQEWKINIVFSDDIRKDIPAFEVKNLKCE